MREIKLASGPSLVRIVVICSIAQNCAMGIAFGSFGPLVMANEVHFHVSRTAISAAMSVLLLALAGLAPVLGGILERTSIRWAMILGAAMSAIAYCGLAVLSSFGAALVMYGLMGIGVCLVAILGPLALINRWCAKDRAKVLGVVNLPIFLFLVPSAVGALLSVHPRGEILGGFGAIFVLLIPLLLLLEDRPREDRQRPTQQRSAAFASDGVEASDPPRFPTRAVLANPAFWYISVGIGLMAGAGTAFVVHAIPFSMGRLMSLREASAILSVYAGTGIVGNLLLGWLADRVGPSVTLCMSALCQAFLWFGMLHSSGAALYVIAGLLGICLIPLATLHGAALSELYGAANISRAMGFSYTVKLPFLLGFAPCTALLFEHSGRYDLPFRVTAATLVVSAILFFITGWETHAKRKILHPATSP
jgi:MFS family permease